MALFNHYIGVDYSGAETAASSLKALRVYAATPLAEPEEVLPPPSPRKYWSRRVPQFFHPPLDPQEREIAEVEGWILGVW
jgi:hypothetical protein